MHRQQMTRKPKYHFGIVYYTLAGMCLKDIILQNRQNIIFCICAVALKQYNKSNRTNHKKILSKLYDRTVTVSIQDVYISITVQKLKFKIAISFKWRLKKTTSGLKNNRLYDRVSLVIRMLYMLRNQPSISTFCKWCQALKYGIFYFKSYRTKILQLTNDVQQIDV